MDNIEIRRYLDGDEKEIVKIIKESILKELSKDYQKEVIDRLIDGYNEKMIKIKAKDNHTYVVLNKEKIIGVGMIGPYWDMEKESSLYTIFVDPKYKGQGFGRIIIETLEKDEYYKNSNRIEVPSSITAVEFYKHFGWNFKKLGNIVDEEGIYRMEKFPKEKKNIKKDQYNMRPYINNKYHQDKEFIYQLKKSSYQKYVEEYWGPWNEEVQRKLYEDFINTVYKDTWLIQLNGEDIGFYNGMKLDENNYEIGNICIVKEYQSKGIGTQVLKDILELHKRENIHIQYFKNNKVGELYKRLGFIPNGETEYHYKMIKNKTR